MTTSLGKGSKLMALGPYFATTASGRRVGDSR